MGDDYNPTADFAASVDECYRAIRERVAAGGPGWGGWPAGVHPDAGGQGITKQPRQGPDSFSPLAAQDRPAPVPPPLHQPAGDLMKYPWMPMFWGDFLANTMHLSAQEAGAYLFLIAHAWEHGGEIPGEATRLARIAHVRRDRWNDVWKVLEPLFEPSVVTPFHGYHHRRVHDELQRLGKISNNRKAAALQKHSNSFASAPASTSTSNRNASFNGKEGEAPAVQVQADYRDKGVEYRSPPKKKVG